MFFQCPTRSSYQSRSKNDMTRSRVLVGVLLCSLAAVVLYCTKQPIANVGGSGSEVVGVLVDQSGHEVSGAIVKLDTLISDSMGAADKIGRASCRERV